RNEFLRREQETVERRGVPGDARVLHCRRIVVTVDLRRVTADDARKTRADQVPAGVDRMTRLALTECLTSGSGVAVRRRSGGRGSCGSCVLVSTLSALRARRGIGGGRFRL